MSDMGNLFSVLFPASSSLKNFFIACLLFECCNDKDMYATPAASHCWNAYVYIFTLVVELAILTAS